ncbi:hypothetical protein B0H14DRAFT_2703072, partial [Mycena olivaceomarginata]
MPTMLLVASLLVAGLTIQAVRTQATMYGVSYGPQDTDFIIEETVSFSVAGVGPSGVMTYIEEFVESYKAFVDAISATTHTFVFLDSPKTFDWVFVESSGGFSEFAILSTILFPETVTDFSFGCATGVDSKPTCTSSATLDTISTHTQRSSCASSMLTKKATARTFSRNLGAQIIHSRFLVPWFPFIPSLPRLRLRRIRTRAVQWFIWCECGGTACLLSLWFWSICSF